MLHRINFIYFIKLLMAINFIILSKHEQQILDILDIAKLSPSSSLAKANLGLSLVLIWLPPAPTHSPATHPDK